MQNRSIVWAIIGLALGLPAILLTASTFYSLYYQSEPNAILAKVGEFSITGEQLRLRQAHIDYYYPGAGSPEAALAQLVQGYLSATILARRGVPLDRASWAAEDERVLRETKHAEKLAELKALYGDDSENWLYVGVLPDFAQGRAFRLFRNSSQFGEDARAQAAALLREVQSDPAMFALAAERHGFSAKTMLISRAHGFVEVDANGERRAEENRGNPESQESAQLLLERLAEIDPGTLYLQALETPDSFFLIRLLDRTAEGANVEMVSIAKPTFDEWFWGEAADVPVSINDAGLRGSFQAAVAWSKRLNLQ